MKYSDIREDMLLAEIALEKSLLDRAVYGRELMCEVYCLTSFHWQSFYLRVYDGEQYLLQFAKPFWVGPTGLKSVSVSFGETAKADSHPAFRGDVYCGMKLVPKDDITINMLLRCLPKNDEVEEPFFMIDGVTTVIVNSRETHMPVLCFRQGKPFLLKSFTEEEASFLEDMHIRIEELIGNLIVRKR